MTRDDDPKSHAWAVLLSAQATLIEKIEAVLAQAKLTTASSLARGSP